MSSAVAFSACVQGAEASGLLLNDDDSSSYVITLGCVTFCALLWRWWSRYRRHADAPSFPSVCVLPVAVLRGASPLLDAAGGGDAMQSGLACVGVASSAVYRHADAFLCAMPRLAESVSNGLAALSCGTDSSSWCELDWSTISIYTGVALACWLCLSLATPLLCNSSRTRTRYLRLRRATYRHRGNRPTPAPWHDTYPKHPNNNNNNRRARAIAYSSPDHYDLHSTSVFHSPVSGCGYNQHQLASPTTFLYGTLPDPPC